MFSYSRLAVRFIWGLATLLGHISYAQSPPCGDGSALAGIRPLHLSLASFSIQQLRPASQCAIWAEASWHKRTYLAYASAEGLVADTFFLPADSASFRLLRVPAGAMRLRLGPLEDGLQGVVYPWQMREGRFGSPRSFTFSMKGVGGIDILSPIRPDPTVSETKAYQRLHFHLLAAGCYANQLALMVRRMWYSCLEHDPPCCEQPPHQAYYLVLLTLNPEGEPTASGAKILTLPEVSLPPPEPRCGKYKAPWAGEEPVGLLHIQQPVAYIGSGTWLCNTGAALVELSPKAARVITTPSIWRPSQTWVEGILSDEAGLVPHVMVRRGGLLEGGQGNEAFAKKNRFRIGGLFALPFTELPKGRHATQVEELQTQNPDWVLERMPLGYAGGHWWLSGTGMVQPRQN